MDLRAKLGRLRAQHPSPPPPPAPPASALLERSYEYEPDEPCTSEAVAARIGAHFFAVAAARESHDAARLEHALDGRDAEADNRGRGLRAEPRLDLRAKLARLRAENPVEQTNSAAESCDEAAAAPLESCESEQPLSAFAEAQRARFEATRAERIAKLRTLIAEVSARHPPLSPPPVELDPRRAREPELLLGAVHSPFRPSLLRAEDLSLPPRLGMPQSAALPWTCMDTAHGTLHYVERWLEPDHHHGHAPVRDGLRLAPGILSVLARDRSLADVDLSRALFLDTETTGLSGGMGTVAFLVGLARYEDGVLCVEQLLVPELGREGPVLARLAERLAAASCIVSYNGKSFDWPLLRNRFVLTRMPVPPVPAHIDLLHATRRIWKGRLDRLCLTDIEREILHFERRDDISGAEIPARYFEFLRGGEAERLAPILEHNQNDVIALAALLGALHARFEQLEGVSDAGDALAFGRLALRMRDAERAAACARSALAASSEDAALREALLFASEVARRNGDPGAAIERLEQALSLEPAVPLKAAIHCSLAKLYEHAQRDLASALRHARHSEASEGSVAHGRRLGRLHRRLLRGAA